jgi:hypothetical protein
MSDQNQAIISREMVIAKTQRSKYSPSKVFRAHLSDRIPPIITPQSDETAVVIVESEPTLCHIYVKVLASVGNQFFLFPTR